MKNCQVIEKKLVAYLHGELGASDLRRVEQHLAGCDACRAELDAHRATLRLLGEALKTAPAPAELPAWGFLPNRISVCRPKRVPWERPRRRVDKRQFKTRLAAVAVSSCCHFFVLALAGGMVVFSVIKKGERKFCPPPPIERPKMDLKKPRVKVKKTASPRSTQRIRSKSVAGMPDVQLPDSMGATGSLDGYAMSPKDDKDSRGFLWDPLAADAEADTSGPSLSGGLAINSMREDSRIAPPEERLAVATLRGSDRKLEADAVSMSKRKLSRYEPLERKAPTVLRAQFNPYILAEQNAFSTFSIDVDTASYGLVRTQLLKRHIPQPETVRTEEFINSFDYDYRPPTGKQTFAVHKAMAPSPFRCGMDVLKIGIKGRRIGRDDHRGAVLTLVIDTSGSMSTPERLGLVKQSLALLFDQLSPADQVAIVQFGGAARLVLDHTPVSEKAVLLDAIDSLQASGPTQFDKGLALGYRVASDGFRAGDSNRIMILSDGVANLGELDPEVILEQVAASRKKGIYLSVLGFGAGVYDDDLLERLANRGDGMYAYIDTEDEARRLLVDQLASTLHVIASDVKIQVEFNPARVVCYRQLGYENRQLTKEQFRDDTVDAGEVGSGQSVTALYDVELIPDGPLDQPICTVYVRYRRGDNGEIEEISSRVTDTVSARTFDEADARFKLAVCAAELAEHLRRSPYAEGTEMQDVFNQMTPVVQALDLDEQVREVYTLIGIVRNLER